MGVDGASWDPRVPLTPLRPDDPPQFANYRVLGRLGSGGLGDAFLAQDGSAWVVIKAVRPGVAETEALRARLGREINAISMITSPYVARVLGSDLEAQRPWFAMEFVPGITLERAVGEDGPLRPDDLMRFSVSLAQAVEAVHRAGVIHRDLKPANIMLSTSGPRLIDFGIADIAGGTRLTQEGASLGTLFWMSPEQVIGEHATTATDVHAWGLVTYFAATGQPPFTGENSVAAMYQVLNVTPTLPPGYPPALAGAISQALAKDPRRRPSITEILALLGPTHAPAPGPFPGAAAGAAYPAGQYWATPQPGVEPAAYQYWPPPQAPPPGPPPAPGTGQAWGNTTPPPPAYQPGAGYPPGYPAGPMQNTPIPAAVPAGPPPGKKGHRGRNLALAGVALLVVVGGLGTAGILAMNGEDTPTDGPSGSSSASQGSSESASPSESGKSGYETAVAEFPAYKEGKPGDFSKPIEGSGEWAAVAVEGQDAAIKLHTFLAETGATSFWMEKDETGTTWGNFTKFNYQYVDATGQGQTDILVRAKRDDESWTGLVALDTGAFATFLEDGEEYVGYYNLNYSNGHLIVEGEPDKKFKFQPKTGSFKVTTGTSG